jgi:hypothetical protein
MSPIINAQPSTVAGAIQPIVSWFLVKVWKQYRENWAQNKKNSTKKEYGFNLASII